MRDAEDDMVDEDDMCFFMYFCICSRASAVAVGVIVEAPAWGLASVLLLLLLESAGKQLLADVIEMTDSKSLL